MRRIIFGTSLVLLLVAGCEADRAGGRTDTDPGATSGSAAPTGTLSLRGDVLAAPGEYELRTSCSYDRRHGAFSLGMHPDVETGVDRGPATFGIGAGRSSRTTIPLEDGTYDAKFEYTEVTGDGSVPTFSGAARLTLEIVDDSRERFPVLRVEAAGQGEGMQFEMAGRCQATVMG